MKITAKLKHIEFYAISNRWYSIAGSAINAACDKIQGSFVMKSIINKPGGSSGFPTYSAFVLNSFYKRQSRPWFEQLSNEISLRKILSRNGFLSKLWYSLLCLSRWI